MRLPRVRLQRFYSFTIIPRMLRFPKVSALLLLLPLVMTVNCGDDFGDDWVDPGPTVVSGTVLRDNGAPLAGVEITITWTGYQAGAGCSSTPTSYQRSTTTGSDGSYEFSDASTSFWQEPVKVHASSFNLTSDYTFTPSAHDITLSSGDKATGLDFVAASAYRISGHVLGAAGETYGLLYVNMDGSRVAWTLADGSYEFRAVRPGEHLIEPTMTGYIYEPAIRSVRVINANVTGVDFIATPVAP